MGVKTNGEARREGGGALGVLVGEGLSGAAFVQLLVALVAVAVLATGPEQRERLLASGAAWAALAGVIVWVAPLQEIAYVIDRIGAVRAQTKNLAPYALDLLPQLPQMLPFLGKIIDNIEQLGPFIPKAMEPGCKEHLLPIMPMLMPDLDIMLPAMDTLSPALPKIAPHMLTILPYTRELLPYSEQLICIVEVEGWHKVNPYLGKVVPHIAKIAPHAQILAKHLPEMLPYMDVLMKHIDNLVDELDETVGVLDKVVPLMPLVPAADQLGLLSQKLAFKALPTVVGFVPLSNNTTGRAAVQAAQVHTRLVAKASELQRALMNRYELYLEGGSKAVADAPPLSDGARETIEALSADSSAAAKLAAMVEEETKEE